MLLKLLPTFRELFETLSKLELLLSSKNHTLCIKKLVLFLPLSAIQSFKVDRLNQFGLMNPAEAACTPTTPLHWERFPLLQEM